LVRDWTAVLEILSPLAVDRADEAASEIRRYLGELAQERRAKPADDLISALVADEDAGGCLTEDELVTMAALIFGADFETTTGLLANGFVALLENPAQAERLRSEPDLARAGTTERRDDPGLHLNADRARDERGLELV
jgi:cytochrome P450